MAKTATERAALHRDRERRGVIAVVSLEVDQSLLKTICDWIALDSDVYPDGDYRKIPREALEMAAQNYVDAAAAHFNNRGS